jgi:hypothetical protein
LGYGEAFRREVARQVGVDQHADIYNQTQTEERPSTTFDISAFVKNLQSVEVRRLQAPGADVKLANVTQWAGQTFESGVASGERVVERVQGGEIAVAASEVVLVFL